MMQNCMYFHAASNIPLTSLPKRVFKMYNSFLLRRLST